MTEKSAILARVSDYWFGLAGGTVPERSLVDPSHIRWLLPYLIIVEFEAAPFRVLYRLSGTKVDEFTGLNLTGRYLDSFAGGTISEAVATLHRSYEECWRSGRPVEGRYIAQSAANCETEIRFGLFPLNVDGAVRQCLAVEDYGPNYMPPLSSGWTCGIGEK